MIILYLILASIAAVCAAIVYRNIRLANSVLDLKDELLHKSNKNKK
jgi:hypothetical protein